MFSHSVRQKMLAAFGGAFVLAACFLYLVTQGVVLQGFARIEQDFAVRGVERARDALQEELATIDATCGDWAAWNDTRDFVLGNNPTYREDNLATQSLATINLNFMVAYDETKELSFLVGANIDDGSELPPPADLEPALKATPALFSHTSPSDTKTGLLKLHRGVALVAAWPITSNERELPIHGTLIMGRYFDDAQIARLAERTHQDLTFLPADSPPAAEQAAQLHAAGSEGGGIAVETVDNKTIVGYTAIPDLSGNPVLLLQVIFPRSISKQGVVTARIFMGVLLGAGAVALLALLFTTERVIIGPVGVLARHVGYIREQKDLHARLEPRSRDEVGALTVGFNEMVDSLRRAQEELEETHHQLLESARLAGMSEVASGVLHNVGNVMNSVNITAATLNSLVDGSKLPNLRKAVELLEAHKDDLGAYLTEDPKGQKLPEYFSGLSEHLMAERDEISRTCAQLLEHIRHTVEIIALQQAFSKNVSLIESTRLQQVIEDAIQINAVALDRHRINVTCQLEPLPPIPCDRHRLLQIVVNLLSNAKNAAGAAEQEEKHVLVSLKKAAPGTIRIEVSDNGIGIPEDKLTDIFTFGFTTRKEGHGYGLHTAALNARQLGGTLVALSGGPGQGATFRLDLPAEGKGTL